MYFVSWVIAGYEWSPNLLFKSAATLSCRR
jgi:hypothetical protein